MNREPFTFYLPVDKQLPAFQGDIDAPVVALIEGEIGYWPIYSRADVDDLNLEPLPPEVAEAALAGSMFGWHVPAAAEAAAWAKKF
jgi:hypothetical protein